MSFLYPRDVIPVVKDAWNKFQGPQQMRLVASWNSKGRMRVSRKRVVRTESSRLAKIPFPSDEALTYLLDAVFHASLSTEEGRRLAVRVAFLPSSISEEVRRSDLNCYHVASKLVPAWPLTAPELLRLAPAINPLQTLILIEDAIDKQSGRVSPLTVWGIVHTGIEWWEAVTGRSSSATCPPNVLTVSSFGPGQVTISAAGQVLLRLRGGSLVVPPLGGLDEGPVGAFFRKAANDLYTEACRQLRRRRYDNEETSDEHPRTVYFRSLANILLRARERLHGGTFVVVRDAFSVDDPRLRDRLSLKYAVDGISLWPHLVAEAVAKRKFYDLLFPKRRVKAVTSSAADKAQEALYWAGQRHETAVRELSELETLIAGLSGVDGAVVLTDHLRVLGFGGEITAASPTLSRVRVARDPMGRAGAERDITTFGTRHRSALRFCSSLEDAICFVISQDGDMRAIKREGSELLLWNDLDLGRTTI